MNSRPDKPLVVKCTFDRSSKKISFSSARNCSYDLLKTKVEQCFSLYTASYVIAYKDDDGEVSDIATDTDLTEAIQYFQAGTDDPPISSAASILSGRSFGSRRITLRVHITVDYDGPSLSDTSSLASMDDYKGRNGSQQSFSFSAAAPEFDDDSVTVSSRDANGPSHRPEPRQSGISETLGYEQEEVPSAWDSQSSSSLVQSFDSMSVNGLQVGRPTERSSETLGRTPHGQDPFADSQKAPAPSQYPQDPSAVYERLKMQEASADHTTHPMYDASVSTDEDRGAAWLRDQNSRTIKSMLGAIPEPSDSDGASFSLGSGSLSRSDSRLSGDLSLRRDPRGKYYYSYSSSSAPISEAGLLESRPPSIYEEVANGQYGASEASIEDSASFAVPRPTSMQLSWLAAQQRSYSDDGLPRKFPSTSLSRSIPMTSNSDPQEYGQLDSDIPPEVLQFVPIAPPSHDSLTDCSECGVLLDSIRYVCSACGEKTPVAQVREEEIGKGKGRMWGEEEHDSVHIYPPHNHRSPLSSSPMSSRTVVAAAGASTLSLQKPLPSLPNLSSSPYNLTPPDLHSPMLHSPMPSVEAGYELCSGCIESAGVNHALEVNLAPGTSPSLGNSSPSSPEDEQRALSQWRRSAPKQKGRLRHAYFEKVWGHRGWEDVEQDDMQACRCSTCNTVIINKRYKCASCKKFNLCRACFGQVHDIHPSHAFLVVPDKPVRARSAPDPQPIIPLDPSDEQSMTHPGVKCAHCMLDIVGARFHCAICDSVDICSNCESAGLPGNLDSSDDGHNSSHIMIKIPYPLEITELQTASRTAVNLWTGRDASSVMKPVSKPSSVYSSYAHTVVGSGVKSPIPEEREDDHHKFCNACNNPIFGVRYQCGSCQSIPAAYNLCSSCEARSYTVHDPMHIFFKLPRPVQNQLESARPLIPELYKSPVGPRGHYDPMNPKEYLKSLVHSAALCDRCMTSIQGEWFRCAYCPKDLCDACEALDTHNNLHVFFVFKAPVDMNNKLRQFARLDNPEDSPPVIPYPVYL